MALVVTPGASDADSYASLAEANTYNSNRLHVDDWSTDDVTKEAALKWAAILLDSNPRAWTGAAASETQALGWPRTGMTNRNGFAIAIDAVPIELKRAQAEFARQLIAADRTADNSVINQGILGLKAGSVQVSFAKLETNNSSLVARSIREMNALAAVLPDAVKYLLVPSWLIDDAEDSQNTSFTWELL